MKAQARQIHADSSHLGFQIAPMIDVVFVIMLFFMVMAGTMKTERLLSTPIPSDMVTSESIDELVLFIAEDGYVHLNDEEIGRPGDGGMSTLVARMTGIREECEARGAKLQTTLQTEEGVRYQLIIDVVNALSKAKVTGVIFTIGSEEE